MRAVVVDDESAVGQPVPRAVGTRKQRGLGAHLGLQRTRGQRRCLHDPGEGRSSAGGIEQPDFVWISAMPVNVEEPPVLGPLDRNIIRSEA